MHLYTYFRSSASYRVRICLNLKGLPYDATPVHLTNNGGEQRREEFVHLNPEALVPVLLDDDQVLVQSMAIVEYLDETYPDVPMLPDTIAGRARVRALAQLIACDVHPLNNLRVLQYLGTVMKVTDEQKTAWFRHWTGLGLTALEKRLACDSATGAFCHGDTPGLADLCMVPLVFNAKRFDCDLSDYPTVMRIHDACMELAAFQEASPGRQFDAP